MVPNYHRENPKPEGQAGTSTQRKTRGTEGRHRHLALGTQGAAICFCTIPDHPAPSKSFNLCDIFSCAFFAFLGKVSSKRPQNNLTKVPCRKNFTKQIDKNPMSVSPRCFLTVAFWECFSARGVHKHHKKRVCRSSCRQNIQCRISLDFVIAFLGISRQRGVRGGAAAGRGLGKIMYLMLSSVLASDPPTRHGGVRFFVYGRPLVPQAPTFTLAQAPPAGTSRLEVGRKGKTPNPKPERPGRQASQDGPTFSGSKKAPEAVFERAIEVPPWRKKCNRLPTPHCPCSCPDWFGVAGFHYPDPSDWSQQPDWYNNSDNYELTDVT
jgi:hypothetical protein